MKIPTSLLFLYCDQPLHVSTGNETDGIDKPIQRERISQIPTAYASGLKGALRHALTDKINDDAMQIIFGPDPEDEDSGSIENAGSLMLSDARLLLFPVPSAMGTFAWVTSLGTLIRFQNALKQVTTTSELTTPTLPDKPPHRGQAFAILPEEQGHYDGPVYQMRRSETYHVFLEEFLFEVDAEQSETVQGVASKIASYAFSSDHKYWGEKLQQALIILHDDDFRYFTRFGTDVRDRIRIDKGSRTVARTGLWTEESLPVDSILYSVVRMNHLYASTENFTNTEEALTWTKKQITDRFQMGGNATLSQGIVMPKWI